MISRVALAVLIAGYSILPGIHAQPVGSEDKARRHRITLYVSTFDFSG